MSEKQENYVILSGQNLKFGDFMALMRRVPQKYELRSDPHVQRDYLCSFNQSISLFCSVIVDDRFVDHKVSNKSSESCKNHIVL